MKFSIENWLNKLHGHNAQWARVILLITLNYRLDLLKINQHHVQHIHTFVNCITQWTKKKNLFYRLFCSFIKTGHTYIHICTLQPFSRDFDLASSNTCAVVLYMTDKTFSLKAIPNAIRHLLLYFVSLEMCKLRCVHRSHV